MLHRTCLSDLPFCIPIARPDTTFLISRKILYVNREDGNPLEILCGGLRIQWKFLVQFAAFIMHMVISSKLPQESFIHCMIHPFGGLIIASPPPWGLEVVRECLEGHVLHAATAI